MKHVNEVGGTQYLRIKLTIERPSYFMVQAAWENDITVGTYGNNMIINIKEVDQFLNEKFEFEVVAEMSLAAGGILGLSMLDDPDNDEWDFIAFDEVPMTEYSYLDTDTRVGAAYKVPDDAAIGDIF